MLRLKTIGGAVALSAILALGACSNIYRNHGYIPDPDILQSVQVGGDSRASVVEKLGEPATRSTVSDETFYYIRQRIHHRIIRRPEVVDREVLAVSFRGDRVSNLETFGLRDGKVVALSRRVTSSGVQDLSFVRQLMGAIGNFSAGDFLN